MKKFSMFAAIAAMIAVGSLAHAETEGDDAGAYLPGPERLAPPPPLAPPPIPYPLRLKPNYIAKCVITDIGRFNAMVIYLGTNQGEYEEARIGPIRGGLVPDAVAKGLIDGGGCGKVEIDWGGNFRAEMFGHARPPAPPVGGPLHGGPVPPGY